MSGRFPASGTQPDSWNIDVVLRGPGGRGNLPLGSLPPSWNPWNGPLEVMVCSNQEAASPARVDSETVSLPAYALQSGVNPHPVLSLDTHSTQASLVAAQGDADAVTGSLQPPQMATEQPVSGEGPQQQLPSQAEEDVTMPDSGPSHVSEGLPVAMPGLPSLSTPPSTQHGPPLMRPPSLGSPQLPQVWAAARAVRHRAGPECKDPAHCCWTSHARSSSSSSSSSAPATDSSRRLGMSGTARCSPLTAPGLCLGPAVALIPTRTSQLARQQQQLHLRLGQAAAARSSRSHQAVQQLRQRLHMWAAQAIGLSCCRQAAHQQQQQQHRRQTANCPRLIRQRGRRPARRERPRSRCSACPGFPRRRPACSSRRPSGSRPRLARLPVCPACAGGPTSCGRWMRDWSAPVTAAAHAFV